MEWELAPVMPDEVDECVAAWQDEHARLLRVDTITQPTGRSVYALTLTNPEVSTEKKARLFFSVPHAHEPAGTAACMKVIQELLTGRGFDNEPSPLDSKRILNRCLLTFLPDVNPHGRASAPVRFWDGYRCDDHRFLLRAFGEDPDRPNEKWPRVDIWDRREVHVLDPIGIVYEPVDEHTFVEPNRNRRSSLFRLFFKLDELWSYHRGLDLHQTEFTNSDRNCMVLLSIMHEELPDHIRETSEKWGAAIVSKWQQMDESPKADVKPLGYGGIQREYFVKTWADIYRRLPYLVTEVQNNNPRTPPARQVGLQRAAILQTIEHALACAEEGRA